MKFRFKKIYIIFSLYLFIFGFENTVLAASTLNCDVWGNTLNDLNNFFNFCKIVIPLLVIGLSTYDFIKALTGKDDKDVKKAFRVLLKRFALAIVFFFLPVIINFLLNALLGINDGVCVGLN